MRQRFGLLRGPFVIGEVTEAFHHRQPSASRGTSDRSAYRVALSFATLWFGATPPPRKDLRSPAELQLCTRCGWRKYLPSSTTDWICVVREPATAVCGFAPPTATFRQPLDEVSAIFTTDRVSILVSPLQGLKPLIHKALSARLEWCPDTNLVECSPGEQAATAWSFPRRSNRGFRHPAVELLNGLRRTEAPEVSCGNSQTPTG